MLLILLFLYVIIGSVVTFALSYHYEKKRDIFYNNGEDDRFYSVTCGVIWPISLIVMLLSLPFKLAIYFALKLNNRK